MHRSQTRMHTQARTSSRKLLLCYQSTFSNACAMRTRAYVRAWDSVSTAHARTHLRTHIYARTHSWYDAQAHTHSCMPKHRRPKGQQSLEIRGLRTSRRKTEGADGYAQTRVRAVSLCHAHKSAHMHAPVRAQVLALEGWQREGDGSACIFGSQNTHTYTYEYVQTYSTKECTRSHARAGGQMESDGSACIFGPQSTHAYMYEYMQTSSTKERTHSHVRAGRRLSLPQRA